MSSSPQASLVYGTFLCMQEDVDEVLEKLGITLSEEDDDGPVEKLREAFGLDVDYTWGYDYGGIVIKSKTEFSTYCCEPVEIPAVLPEIDPEEIRALKGIAAKLGLKEPSWLLVAFYG
jgi:hypothetical protein